MRFLAIIGLLVILALPQGADASASQNLSGWAWSSTIGWVSFNNTTGGGEPWRARVCGRQHERLCLVAEHRMDLLQ